MQLDQGDGYSGHAWASERANEGTEHEGGGDAADFDFGPDELNRLDGGLPVVHMTTLSQHFRIA